MVNIIYNEFIKNINIDLSSQVGVLQEKILSEFNLSIYDIEYSELVVKYNKNTMSFVKDNSTFVKDTKSFVKDSSSFVKDSSSFVKDTSSFVLGSNKILFSDRLDYFLKREGLQFQDINYIRVYNKKSDNIIIERYNDWYKNMYKNRRILRFPIEVILANILRVDSIQEEEYNSYFDTFEDIKVTLNQDEFNNLEKFYFNSTESRECLICLEKFEINDQVTKIHCNHIFHTICIKEWFLKENSKCPVCRVDVKYKN
jgi:hypothetical protein